jgi:hypothetical protein
LTLFCLCFSLVFAAVGAIIRCGIRKLSVAMLFKRFLPSGLRLIAAKWLFFLAVTSFTLWSFHPFPFIESFWPIIGTFRQEICVIR